MLLTWALFCAFCVICLTLLESPKQNRHSLAFPCFRCLNYITENSGHFTASGPNSGLLFYKSELHSHQMKCVTSKSTVSFLRLVILKRSRVFSHWASWDLGLLGEGSIEFWRQNRLIGFGSWHLLRKLKPGNPSYVVFPILISHLPTQGNHHPETCAHDAFAFTLIYRYISSICILGKHFVFVDINSMKLNWLIDIGAYSL